VIDKRKIALGVTVAATIAILESVRAHGGLSTANANDALHLGLSCVRLFCVGMFAVLAMFLILGSTRTLEKWTEEPAD
jgi:uncharacterized membrane protein